VTAAAAEFVDMETTTTTTNGMGECANSQ